MIAYLIYFLFFVVVVTSSYYVLSRWLPHRSGQRLSLLRKQRRQGRDHTSPLNTSSPDAGDPWIARAGRRWGAWLIRLSPVLLKTPGPSASNPDAKTANADADSPDPLRMRMLNAGIPSTDAVLIYRALQTLLIFILPILILLTLGVLRPALTLPGMAILLVLGAMLGYYLPEAVLNRLIKRRQESLFHGFPDALDLMRMCIQAGMGLDASLDRVGREVRLSCPALAEELAMTGYELRAGASRSEALRHLSQRVGLSDVEAFVGTLIQSDRFGTSVSESLQVYSDALRNKRRLLAQELAAKLPIKLLIPLVFCLFPGLLTVLLGPAIINISTHLLPVLSGQP